jgi:hypothetical protein
MTNLIDKIKSDPTSISFAEVIAFIDDNFEFTPSKFTNGNVINEAGQNSGSCKIFSFAKLNNLNKIETLACFGDFYRLDVLGKPEGNDHQNIRNFMIFGWEAVVFDHVALKAQ